MLPSKSARTSLVRVLFKGVPVVLLVSWDTQPQVSHLREVLRDLASKELISRNSVLSEQTQPTPSEQAHLVSSEQTHPASSPPESNSGLLIDDQFFTDNSLLVATPLYEGVEVALGPARSLDPASHSDLPSTQPPASSVVVVAGPDCGQSVLMDYVVAGRDSSSDLQIFDPEVSLRHVLLYTDVLGNGFLKDLGSRNGVCLDGCLLPSSEVPITPEQRIGLGCSVIAWRLQQGDIIKVPGLPPRLEFHPQPRSQPPPAPEALQVPHLSSSSPGLMSARAPTWATLLIPLALGMFLAVAFNPYMALFCLMGPVMALSSWLESKGKNRKDSRHRGKTEVQARQACLKKFPQVAGQEIAYRRFLYPDPSSVLSWIFGPSERLWECSATDKDFLHVAVGRHDDKWYPELEIQQPEPKKRRRSTRRWRQKPEFGSGAGSSAGGPGSVAGGPGSQSSTPTENLDSEALSRQWFAEAPPLVDVPLAVDLSDSGVGIVGAGSEPFARWLILQAATRHRPSELRIALLGEADSWKWLSWLPHTQKSVGAEVASEETIGFGVTEVGEFPVHTLVLALGKSRHSIAALEYFAKSLEVTSREVASFGVEGPGAESLEVQGLGAESPAAQGFATRHYSLLMLADTAEELFDRWHKYCPHANPQIVLHLLDESGRARVATQPTLGSFPAHSNSLPPPGKICRLDGISLELASRAARHMARFADPKTQSKSLSRHVTLFELLGLNTTGGPTAQQVHNQWQQSTSLRAQITQQATPAQIAAPIGLGASGPVNFNLVTDGPHCLIAGTTGAGKSELLRCLVSSMAFACAPTELNFVLIDYKGGSAFDACATLPHVVGLVTDLDERLGQRALVCLNAELTFRERVLREAEVSEFTTQSTGGESTGGLARLVVVIDEFATLAAELPAFLDSLVGIAQRGRSLGVHLVLATQRPQGAVNAAIRSNTNMRIALRMLDATDSVDVIGTPDAVGISQPGRAYMRCGSQDVKTFQVAEISGSTPPVATEPVVVLGHKEDSKSTSSDLQLLVEAICEAWEPSDADGSRTAENRKKHSLRCPWPPLLPDFVDADELQLSFAPPASSSQPVSPSQPSSPSQLASLSPLASPVQPTLPVTPIALGLADYPQEQSQRPYLWQPGEKNLLFLGLSGSGAQESLLTAALLAVKHNPVSNLHIYGIDHGAGNLQKLKPLAHCGAVVATGETERHQKLLDFLSDTMRERQLSTQQQATQQQAIQGQATQEQATQPPVVLLLIDNLPSLLHSLEEERDYHRLEKLTRLYLDGTAWGINVLASSDSAAPRRFLTSGTEQFLFRLADAAAYSLAGVQGVEPAALCFGRALAAGGVEVQMAAFAPALSGDLGAGDFSFADAVTSPRNLHQQDYQQDSHDAKQHSLPRQISILPHMVRLSELNVKAQLDSGQVIIPFGICSNLAPASLQLKAAQHALIFGHTQTGKSTTLAVIAQQVRAAGGRAVAICPASSPLWSEPSLSAAATTPAELWQLTTSIDPANPIFVLVDDAWQLDDSDGVLEMLIKSVAPELHIVASSGVAPGVEFGAVTGTGAGLAQQSQRLPACLHELLGSDKYQPVKLFLGGDESLSQTLRMSGLAKQSNPAQRSKPAQRPGLGLLICGSEQLECQIALPD